MKAAKMETNEPDQPDDLYPVMLEVSGRACLVVGGGAVAARKARGLVGCGAEVTVIAPDLSEEMERLAPSLRAVERRPYSPGDARGFRLVMTATGRPEVDGAVFADADAAGVWVNSADDRANCSFILPAVHREGPVTLSVSTGGTSPALASWLRTRLALECEPYLEFLAAMLGEARRRVIRAGLPTEDVDWRRLLDGPLPDLVRTGDLEAARTLIDEVLPPAARIPTEGSC